MNLIAFRNVVLLLAVLSLVACSSTSNPQPNTSFSSSTLDLGSSNTSATLTLTNSGDASSSWSANDFIENAANPEALPVDFEVTVNPASGSIAAGSSQTINISIDRSKLAVQSNALNNEAKLQSGSYQVELRFTIDGNQKSVNLSFTVTAQANTNFSSSSLDFGSNNNSVTTSLVNSGTATSTWETINFIENASNPAALPTDFTINVQPFSGTLQAGASQTITITLDRTKLTTLTNGSYQLELRFNVDGVQKSINLAFTLGTTTPPTPSGGYSIQLEFSGSDFTPSRQTVFQTAASIWAEAITGDLPDVKIGNTASDDIAIPANLCGFEHPAFTGVIDDLLIFAQVVFIDGPGNTLAQAGPLSVDGGPLASRLPFVGCMQFDSADIAVLEADGTLQNTIVHEMGHVLGIGTLWSPLSTGICAEPAAAGSPTFTGAAAVTEWTTLKGGTPSGNVPIEDAGGPGTQCGHWDEETFFTELMTGFLNTSADALSRLTIGSLKDLGYTVDLSKAEPYSLPSCSPNCTGLKSASHQGAWESIKIYTLP